ncbi:MAG: GxxExxY protein [Bacteroidetes bacterium]|nr:MAG: GxxExxY protein [Bacteroidota bacterium]
MTTQKCVNDIAYQTVGCAIEVHKHMGPGLLESVHEECLVDELITVGLFPKRQIAVPISYKGKELASPLKLDLIINDLVIVEIKSVEVLLPVFTAQLLTYLKLSGEPKGLLINFNCENITKHLIPLVTDEFAKLPKP